MLLYPPKFNINKFIYGKLGEEVFRDMCETVTQNKCPDLDTEVIGACYKNDCILDGHKYSIKCMKQKSSVTVINKNNNYQHNLNGTNFAVINILSGILYIFQYDSIFMEKFVKDSGPKIEFKSSLFTFLEKKHPEFCIKLPKNRLFNDFMEKKYNTIEPIDLVKHHYELLKTL